MTTDNGRTRRRLLSALGVLVVTLAALAIERATEVGAGHGAFTRGDVLVAHDGGIQWWSGGRKEAGIATADRVNYGLAFNENEGGRLYAAYRREVWHSRHYRPPADPPCVETPASRDERATPPTYTTAPPPSTPCQTLWPETSWVARFTAASQPDGDLGGRPHAHCRRPPNNMAERLVCDDFATQAVAVGKDNTVYVGAALGGIIKVTGDTRTHFDLPRHIVGASFMALSPDKCTAYYTSLDPAVHRFEVCLGVPLPDLIPALPATLPKAPGNPIGQLYGVAVRPNGEVFVGSTEGVYRITAAGVLAQTYTVPDSNRFFAVATDPSDEGGAANAFFWAATSDGKVHRLRIDNGTAAGPPLETGVYVLGLVVKGGPPPPNVPIPNVDAFESASRVDEGQSGTREALISVTLSSPPKDAANVRYATADGTATAAGGDYRPATGTLTFAPNETTKSLAIQVIGDTAEEADETFTLNLSDASGATIGKAQATVTIVNDDSPLAAGEDPAAGPGGGGTSQQNQQTSSQNTPPTGTTGGGGTAPSPASVNTASPFSAAAPVAAPTPVAVAVQAPVAAPVAQSATRRPAAPAAGHLRPGRPSGVPERHEMVSHRSSADDEMGTAAAGAGAMLLFGCFAVSLVWASRRKHPYRAAPAFCDDGDRGVAAAPIPEFRERW